MHHERGDTCVPLHFLTIKSKRMKKVMMMTAFLMATVLSFANGNHAENLNPAQAGTHQPEQLQGSFVVDPPSCSVTQKGSISLHFVQYEITCIATRDNCRDAAAEAFNCVREGVKRILSVNQ